MRKLTDAQIGKVFREIFRDDNGYCSNAYFKAVLDALNHQLVKEKIERQIEYNEKHDTFSIVHAILD